MIRGSRAVLLPLLSAILCVSCTTVIHPPAAPVDPQSVILVTHGRSSSLVLYEPDGDASRWAYGDWRFYALGHKRWHDALAAILWPTPSALGRQVIEEAPRTPDLLVSRLGIGTDEVFVLSVEREAAADLQKRLHDLFTSNLDTRHYNSGPRMVFVRHPEPYNVVSSSNRKVARWLRELGCEVTGIPLLSRWRVEPPETED